MGDVSDGMTLGIGLGFTAGTTLGIGFTAGTALGGWVGELGWVSPVDWKMVPHKRGETTRGTAGAALGASGGVGATPIVGRSVPTGIKGSTSADNTPPECVETAWDTNGEALGASGGVGSTLGVRAGLGIAARTNGVASDDNTPGLWSCASDDATLGIGSRANICMALGTIGVPPRAHWLKAHLRWGWGLQTALHLGSDWVSLTVHHWRPNTV
jgi:hypothetical protein